MDTDSQVTDVSGMSDSDGTSDEQEDTPGTGSWAYRQPGAWPPLTNCSLPVFYI